MSFFDINYNYKTVVKSTQVECLKRLAICWEINALVSCRIKEKFFILHSAASLHVLQTFGPVETSEKGGEQKHFGCFWYACLSYTHNFLFSRALYIFSRRSPPKMRFSLTFSKVCLSHLRSILVKKSFYAIVCWCRIGQIESVVIKTEDGYPTASPKPFIAPREAKSWIPLDPTFE